MYLCHDQLWHVSFSWISEWLQRQEEWQELWQTVLQMQSMSRLRTCVHLYVSMDKKWSKMVIMCVLIWKQIKGQCTIVIYTAGTKLSNWAMQILTWNCYMLRPSCRCCRRWLQGCIYVKWLHIAHYHTGFKCTQHGSLYNTPTPRNNSIRGCHCIYNNTYYSECIMYV